MFGGERNLGQGRTLAAPGRFADDDGSADEAIRSAATSGELLRALGRGRLLVAVMPVALSADATQGVASEDKSTDMSVVSMVAPDGRRGLLAFSGLDALHLWDNAARPVPVAASEAARAAIEDGCEALVIDVAGPRKQVVAESQILSLVGIDASDHARKLTQAAMDSNFGVGVIEVEVIGERLRLHVPQPGPSSTEVVERLTPRVLALVPEGVEIAQ